MFPSVTLARALGDDPVFRYFFPDTLLRPMFLRSFFRDEVRYRRTHGQVLRHGAAIALVGDWPHAEFPVDRLGPLTRLLLRLQPQGVRERWVAGELSARRADSPYRYLSAIGTRPECQGRGDGTQLLERVITDARAADLDVYLETGSEGLVRWYSDHGCEVASIHRLPDGPRVVEMVCRDHPQT